MSWSLMNIDEQHHSNLANFPDLSRFDPDSILALTLTDWVEVEMWCLQTIAGYRIQTLKPVQLFFVFFDANADQRWCAMRCSDSFVALAQCLIFGTMTWQSNRLGRLCKTLQTYAKVTDHEIHEPNFDARPSSRPELSTLMKLDKICSCAWRRMAPLVKSVPFQSLLVALMASNSDLNLSFLTCLASPCRWGQIWLVRACWCLQSHPASFWKQSSQRHRRASRLM